MKINETKNIFYSQNKNPKELNNKRNAETLNINNKKKNRTRRNGRCYYSKKMGHYFFECNKRNQSKLKRKNFKKNNYKKYYYRNNKRNYQKNKRYANFIQKDNYNTSYAESFSKDYNTEDTLDINLIEEDHQTNNIITPKKELICWILDSGASINITNCLDKLTNIRNCREKVYFANNKFLITKYIGTFIRYINNYKFIIEEVYYSPEINKNLLSIEQHTKQNYKIIFSYSNNQSCETIYD